MVCGLRIKTISNIILYVRKFEGLYDWLRDSGLKESMQARILLYASIEHANKRSPWLILGIGIFLKKLEIYLKPKTSNTTNVKQIK